MQVCVRACVGRVHNDVDDSAGVGVCMARHHSTNCRRLRSGTGSNLRHRCPRYTRFHLHRRTCRVCGVDQKAGQSRSSVFLLLIPMGGVTMTIESRTNTCA